MSKYRTIVADPPWDHSDGTGTTLRGGTWVPSDGVPYSCMSLQAIRDLPVGEMAQRDAHLYLWTTNRYLRDAYTVAESWGFSPVKPSCPLRLGLLGRSEFGHSRDAREGGMTMPSDHV